MPSPKPCQWEQYAKTAHPSFQRTKVLFCRCDVCHTARVASESARGIPTFRPSPRIKERFEALRWRPEPKPHPELARDGD